MHTEILKNHLRPTQPNILIIEDEPLMSALMERYLQSYCKTKGIPCNYQVLSSGWELLNADLSSIDVAVVDLLLPKITGVDLIKTFRKRHPDMGFVPVSGMATDSMKRDLNEILPDGFELLPKPLRKEDFYQAFDKAWNFKGQQPLEPELPSNEEGEEALWTSVTETRNDIPIVRRRLSRKKVS